MESERDLLDDGNTMVGLTAVGTKPAECKSSTSYNCISKIFNLAHVATSRSQLPALHQLSLCRIVPRALPS